MPDLLQIRRKQLVREAEGYLDLLQPLKEACNPEPAMRNRLARRVLHCLLQLDKPAQQDPHVLYLQGIALRTMEHHAEAIEPLREAATQQPDKIHIWLALAWCCKRTGRLDWAIEAMEEALAAEPREALLHYNLSCYCSLAGQVDRALTSLATALELEPSYRELIAQETDFDPIRKHPSFRELTSVVV